MRQGRQSRNSAAVKAEQKQCSGQGREHDSFFGEVMVLTLLLLSNFIILLNFIIITRSYEQCQQHGLAAG